jgi:predicted branched-subunit amino acid permease
MTLLKLQLVFTDFLSQSLPTLAFLKLYSHINIREVAMSLSIPLLSEKKSFSFVA